MHVLHELHTIFHVPRYEIGVGNVPMIDHKPNHKIEFEETPEVHHLFVNFDNKKNPVKLSTCGEFNRNMPSYIIYSRSNTELLPQGTS